MVDFKIFRASSAELFPNGELNPRLIVEEGCWYLCTDTAELFVGAQTDTGLALKRVNENEINQLPEDVALKSDIENVKQEVIETVVPEVEAVKTKVENVLLPKVEEELAPTVEELKAWVDNKEFLQHIDLEGYASEDYVNSKLDTIEIPDVSNFVTTETINNINYQIQNIQQTYVTNDKVIEIVTEEVSTKVDEQVESKVAEVIQDKVDTGEITISTNAITYGDF